MVFCARSALPCPSNYASRDRACIRGAARSIRVHASWLPIVRVSPSIRNRVYLQYLILIRLQKPSVDNMEECIRSDQFHPEPSEGEALSCLARDCHAESIEGLDANWQGGTRGRKGSFLFTRVLSKIITVDSCG